MQSVAYTLLQLQRSILRSKQINSIRANQQLIPINPPATVFQKSYSQKNNFIRASAEHCTG